MLEKTLRRSWPQPWPRWTDICNAGMSMLLRRVPYLLVLLATGGALGCSSTSEPAGTPPAVGSGGTVTSDVTWKDGQHISSAIVIASGVTVTIAPGAQVTVADGASITLQGTLSGASRDKHAKLTGAAWAGIVVENSGKLALDGVDIENAATAITLNYATASYDYGTISGAIPFAIGTKAKLTASHATVTGAKAPSFISGALVATFLDYDADVFEGLSLNDPAATLSLEDSKIHGKGTIDNDLVAARGAASVHVAYTEISMAHCTFHFENVSAFDISFVSLHDSQYGFMLYGSATAGARTITSANIFKNRQHAVDEGGPAAVNGSITISNGYWADNGAAATDNIRQFTPAIKVSNMSTTTPITGVGPRS